MYAHARMRYTVMCLKLHTCLCVHTHTHTCADVHNCPRTDMSVYLHLEACACAMVPCVFEHDDEHVHSNVLVRLERTRARCAPAHTHICMFKTHVCASATHVCPCGTRMCVRMQLYVCRRSRVSSNTHVWARVPVYVCLRHNSTCPVKR